MTPKRSPSRTAKALDAKRLVEEVERTKVELRDEARARLGVTGKRGDAAPLREVLKRHGVGVYPLVALGALSIADTFHSYAFAVLAPDMSETLGIGKATIAGVIALKTLAISIAPLPMAAWVQRIPRRALLAVLAGIAWSLVAIWTGYVVAIWGLLAAVVLDGLTTGSVSALHTPLLMDSYPPEARVRAMSYYQGATETANAAAPLCVAFLTAVAAFTWRGVFIVLGFLSLGATIAALRLRDPGFGQWDDRQIRETVHEAHGEDAHGLAEEDVSLGFFEIVRRLMLIPTIRRLLLGFAVLGILLIPFQTFLFFFLEERWGMGPGARGLFFAMFAAAGILGLAVFGNRGEDMFREDPAKIMRLSAIALALTIGLIVAAAAVPVFGVMLALFALAGAFLAIVFPIQNVALLSVIPSHMRAHASALTGIFLGGVGGIAGVLFLSGIDSRFGIAGSMVSLLIPGTIGSMIFFTTGKLIQRDMDRMIDEVLEDEEIKRIRRAGEHLPMLACRGLNFAYGQIQVLFDVDFAVADGEMIALLGTNGAGKSTLLKVISGIGLPWSGSVRFRGADITYLDAERRLRLGITQIPGGRAVFGSLTVVDNLRLFGHSIGKDRRALDSAIDRSFESFPHLAERRNQKASTLSGGEQQMLGLAKALILRPRLLLVDELSLGLAPVVVGQLLDMVREINRSGAAVVLVEQSVNLALTLVEHAYFMEKGEIRFDGSSSELLRRTDLLRAIFLEGSVSGNGSTEP